MKTARSVNVRSSGCFRRSYFPRVVGGRERTLPLPNSVENQRMRAEAADVHAAPLPDSALERIARDTPLTRSTPLPPVVCFLSALRLGVVLCRWCPTGLDNRSLLLTSRRAGVGAVQPQGGRPPRVPRAPADPVPGGPPHPGRRDQ